MDVDQQWISDSEIVNYQNNKGYSPNQEIIDILKIKKALSVIQYPSIQETYLMTEVTLLRGELESMRGAFRTFGQILELVAKNETLQQEWERFLVLVKLTANPSDFHAQ